jgi:iron complex outermembrane receptor protein
MSVRLLGIILFSLIFIASSAQHFKGKVMDMETNEPIPFADVFFVELQTGTSTDINGEFLLDDLLSNKLNVQISFLGYKSTIEQIDLTIIHEKVFYLEPSHIDLEEVVFSVPGGKLQGENVVSIERKSLSELEHSSVSLTEAISNIPGVEQNTTGTGIGKPVIRGLSGNRIVTYAQGIRIENQQWGAEHGLGVADLGVESVEVIKGPASLLYGSDAIGGVLYFVDERYAQVYCSPKGNFS